LLPILPSPFASLFQLLVFVFGQCCHLCSAPPSALLSVLLLLPVWFAGLWVSTSIFTPTPGERCFVSLNSLLGRLDLRAAGSIFFFGSVRYVWSPFLVLRVLRFGPFFCPLPSPTG